ncbi:hypothetical protein ABZ942_41430 [Nocardia sp. NPDC046473]
MLVLIIGWVVVGSLMVRVTPVLRPVVLRSSALLRVWLRRLLRRRAAGS